MELERIDHVGLNVRDLRASADFYSRVFGFGIVHKWTTTWMVGAGSIRLGLFQRPAASPVCNIDNAVALTHLALRTDAAGFEAAQQELHSLGSHLTTPRIPESPSRSLSWTPMAIRLKSPLMIGRKVAHPTDPRRPR
jgi:catechol 2,3-dioxygenase-like lactoylglutathione lyase family enzyme